MRRFSGPILLLSLLALLVLQSAGLHLHANTHTEGVQLHIEHVHDADPDGHDHSADVDVSIFELGTLWAKLAFLLPQLGLALLVPIRRGWLSRSAEEAAPASQSQLRWRPPLRAPPLTA
jgi:hypothetical protein